MKLFTIKDEYLEYLKKFDKHVLNNKGESYTKSRKYLGVLLEINGCKYIAPLSSPSKSYDYINGKIRKSIVPVIRMAISETELLGTIKLGCMIPVYDEKIIEYYEVKNENDIKYKKLVLKELEFIYKNKELIIKNANKLYKQKCMNLNIGYIRNTVNFKLLEEKAKEYK